LTSTNFLYELDCVTQEIVNVIIIFHTLFLALIFNLTILFHREL